jgi:hypothetical protein
MGALMQISAVVKRNDRAGRPAVDAARPTGRPSRAAAVMDLSRGEMSTQVPSPGVPAATLVAQGAAAGVLAVRREDRPNVSRAWCEALFASWLQPSDTPTAERVAEAIERTARRFGIGGCAGRTAQEFGDHPEAAAERMRWVRQLAAKLREAGDERDV